ncbi:MAG: hypothetical protein ACI8U3_002823 [Brevundimonas sp.]|jgi:hypothetical protein|uniref:hypothetical protein n=1 Tax=Brevundimonas sp. TaxID=1871086 RepID=UPI0039E2E7FA
MPELFTYDTVDPYGTVPSSNLFSSLQQTDHYIADAFGSPLSFCPDYRLGEIIRRRIPRRATWREREQGFFDSGVYTAPVWNQEPFWRQRPAPLIDHYAHVSLEDPAMVAFTEDEAHGELDRQTRMKPGRYLKRYFSEALTAKQIAYLAEWFVSGSRPPVSMDGAMALTSSGDEITEVYASSISSCMEGQDCVRVYAAGDLAVAFWRADDEEITARCLCWPHRGVYGRTYPDPDASDYARALVQAMEARGWKHERLHDEGFCGARIRKIAAGCGAWVMPYLDLDYGLDDCGRVWRMARSGEYVAERTDGLLYLDDTSWTCDGCGSGMSDDHERYTVCVSVWNGAPGCEHDFCQSCRDSVTFDCAGSGAIFSVTVPSVEVDGHLWARGIAEARPELQFHAATNTFSTRRPNSAAEAVQ